MRFLACLLAASWCSAQELADFRVSVDLVPVTCSVTDHDGRPVAGLRASDFVLLDNGKPQPIEYLWREVDLPLTIGLVVDISGSQYRVVREHRTTVAQFLEQVLRPQDQAFLVAVGPAVKLVTDVTHSADDLRTGVNGLDPRNAFNVSDPDRDNFGEQCLRSPPVDLLLRRGIVLPPPGSLPNWWCGGTLLWNGVYSSARLKMKPVGGRKALIVLTDGMDSGGRFGARSLKDAIEAAQSADTVVYTIHYAAPLPKLMQLGSAAGLRRLSTETGGGAFDDPKGSPSGIFDEIEQDLRSLYVLAFHAPASAQDGKFHKLEVKSKRRGLAVRARKGYLAASQ